MADEPIADVSRDRRRRGVKVRPIVAWYDLWIGAYWDRNGRRLYVLPLPCLGLVIEFGHNDSSFQH